MRLYLVRGEYVSEAGKRVFYCGLPVRAPRCAAAMVKVAGELGTFPDAAYPVERMPDMVLASDEMRLVAERLCADGRWVADTAEAAEAAA